MDVEDGYMLKEIWRERIVKEGVGGFCEFPLRECLVVHEKRLCGGPYIKTKEGNFQSLQFYCWKIRKRVMEKMSIYIIS